MPVFRMRGTCVFGTGCGENSLGRGSRTWGLDPPAPCRPVLGGRCTHTFPAPRTRSPGSGRALLRSGTQADTGLSPGLSRNSRFLLSLPVREGAG